MELTAVLIDLDRLRENQNQVHSMVYRHGELLQELVSLQKELVVHQKTMATTIQNIVQDKASTQSAKSKDESPKPLPLTAKEAIQWVAAMGMLVYVLRGGDPTALLKAFGY